MKRFDRNCPHCGKPFQTTPSKNQRYCSPRCSALCRVIPEKHRSFIKACLECGITFKTVPSINKKFCSQKCCAVYYGKMRRVKNPSNNSRSREKRTKDGRRVLLSRYLMEQKLGRCLKPTEILHHIDIDEQNNPEDCSNYYVCPSLQSHMFTHSSLNKTVKELLAIGIIQFKGGKYIVSQPYFPLR